MEAREICLTHTKRNVAGLELALEAFLDKADDKNRDHLLKVSSLLLGNLGMCAVYQLEKEADAANDSVLLPSGRVVSVADVASVMKFENDLAWGSALMLLREARELINEIADEHSLKEWRKWRDSWLKRVGETLVEKKEAADAPGERPTA